MEIFTLLTMVVFLSVTPNHPTTFQFADSIEYYSLGNQGEFSTYLSQDRKILVITPKVKVFEIPLVVLAKKNSYQFKLISTAKSPPLYLIKKGFKETHYSLLKKTPTYRLLEGKSSLFIKLQKDLTINGLLKKKGPHYLSKGGQLFINGVQVL